MFRKLYSKQVLFVFLFYCLSNPIIAQSPYNKIDSLKQVVIETDSDSTKMETYLALCVEYQGINIDTSLLYGDMSLQLADNRNWSTRQASILLQLGYLNIGLGKLEESKILLDKAMRISQDNRDTFMMINSLNTLGQLNFSMERNDIALKNLQQSYEWAKQINHEEFIIRTSNNLGILSGMNNHYKDAISYFEQTKKYSLLKGDKALANTAGLNIATAHKELGQNDLALKEFQEVLKNLNESNDYNSMANVHLNIGNIYYEKERYNQSLYHINESLKYSRRNKTKSIEEACLYSRALLYNQLDQLENALQDANQGYKIVKATGNGPSNRLKYFSLLATINKSEKKYENALDWQEKYSSLSDSLKEIGRQQEIDELEISFQTKQKEIENENLKKDKASQELIIEQRTRLAIGAGFLLLLLMAIAFLLYQTRKKTKQMNSILEEKVKDRTEDLETSNTLLKQSNEELERFAFIASHDLKEPLRNMGSFVSLIKRRLQQRNDSELLEYIEYAEKSNHQMVELVNNILEYSKLETKKSSKKELVGLQKVVEDISSIYTKSMDNKPFKINYSQLPTVSFYKSTFRSILKNIIENGIKYNTSEVPQIDIDYKAHGNSISLFIKDNGIGIAKEFHSSIFDMFTRLHNREAYSGSGMGLAFCKKLVDSHNGTITIESEEGEGSTFIITLPAEVVE